MLKFTLSALLLTATTAAFAQGEPGEVTLKNNKTVSWSEFVNAINNPSSIQGTVPDNSDVAVNLKTAQTNYDKAVSAAATADAAVKAAEGAYNKANKYLTQWQGLLSTETANYQQKYAELQDLRSQLYDLKNAPKVTAPWLQNIILSVNTFKGIYDGYLASDGDYVGIATVYYRIQKSGRITVALYLSFSGNPNDGNTWTQIGESELYGIANQGINGSGVPNKVYVYLGEDYTVTTDHCLATSYSANPVSLVQSVSDALQILANDESYKVSSNAAEITNIENKITTCSKELSDIADLMNGYQANIDKLTKPVEGGDTRTGLEVLFDNWEEANAKKIDADGDVTEAETALNNAKEAYKEAEAAAAAEGLANYKDVTLNADVTAYAVLNSFDGTINGNGHIITLAEGTPQLITTFGGTLIDVAVNGTLSKANATMAAFRSVASWNGTSGAFYNVDGVKSDNLTIGALGFAAREHFGVDFNAKTIVPSADATKVYNVTVYEPGENKTPVQMYVQVKDSKLTAENGQVVNLENLFAKSETNDLEGVDNVFFNDGTCKKVVITDRKKFYCPQAINAEVVEYNRTFNQGYNSVCLPFALSSNANGNIQILSRYDKETKDKFWFKKVAEEIPANTPMLLVATNEFSLEPLSNVQIAATPKAQIIEDEGDAEEISKAYGVFKIATRDEFKGGASEAHKVYGLTAAEGTFSPAVEEARFPAFRMVIWSNEENSAGSQRARKIAIVDEKGVEITDITTSAINTPETVEFEITTAPGEIIIASEADLDQVAVYSMDGKLAAVVDVKAGIAATVDVQPGLYVVMGKKVMVK